MVRQMGHAKQAALSLLHGKTPYGGALRGQSRSFGANGGNFEQVAAGTALYAKLGTERKYRKGLYAGW